MVQAFFHYSMHFLVPGFLAWLFFRPVWFRAWMIMLMTMAVDLDHFLSDPVFDPDRCGIGHHPLHTLPAIVVYALLLFVPKRWVKMVALGLLFHMLTDFIDCLWMFSKCTDCCEKSTISWICNWLEG